MPYPTAPIAQLVPVAGGISTPVIAGASTIQPVQHNESISGGLLPVLISTATTTTVVTGSGRLCRIHCYGGTLGAVTAYDNTAGSGVAIPLGPRAAGAYLPVAGLYDDFQIAFTTGLTIVTSAATLLAVTFERLI